MASVLFVFFSSMSPEKNLGIGKMQKDGLYNSHPNVGFKMQPKEQSSGTF